MQGMDELVMLECWDFGPYVPMHKDYACSENGAPDEVPIISSGNNKEEDSVWNAGMEDANSS
jgi:hypothetical protein